MNLFGGLLSERPEDLTTYFHSNEEPLRANTPLSTSLDKYVEIVLNGTSSLYTDL